MGKKSESIAVNGLLNIIIKCCHIIIPLITFPYLSRVLGAENYGKFSFALSINSYLLLITMLGIDTYAVREASRFRDDKRKLFEFTSQITFINMCSLLIALSSMAVLVTFNTKIKQYDILVYLLSMILICTFLGRDWINTVFEDYTYITIRYIVIQLIGVFAIFLFIKNAEDYILYTLIYSLTVSLGYIINLFYTQKYVKFGIAAKGAKKHIFPIILLFGGQIATNIYLQSDITMLGFFGTDSDVGIYTISSKIYLLSKMMINALTAVTIPRIVFSLGKGCSCESIEIHVHHNHRN